MFRFLLFTSRLHKSCLSSTPLAQEGLSGWLWRAKADSHLARFPARVTSDGDGIGRETAFGVRGRQISDSLDACFQPAPVRCDVRNSKDAAV